MQLKRSGGGKGACMPLMFAPAMMPVTAGKNIANTEKKLYCVPRCSVYPGPMLSFRLFRSHPTIPSVASFVVNDPVMKVIMPGVNEKCRTS